MEKLFAFLHLPVPSFAMVEHPYLAPAVRMTMEDGAVAGVMGRLKPSLADAYLARKAVWYADLDLDLLRAASQGRKTQFQALPVFPAVRRDITFIAPRSMHVDAVLAAVRGAKTNLMESVELLDVYEPKGGEERNITCRITFRKADRTLQDGEVDKEREKIASFVVKSLGVRI